MHDIFGDWPNLMQGLVGSALGSGLGVFGAFLVATKTIRSDRKARREQAGADAAAAILETVLPLPQMVRGLKKAKYESMHGLSDAVTDRWQKLRTAYDVSVLRYSHLLPHEIAVPVQGLREALENVVIWEVDEENRMLIEVMPPPADVLEQIATTADSVQDLMSAYAAQVLGAPSLSGRRARRRRG